MKRLLLIVLLLTASSHAVAAEKTSVAGKIQALKQQAVKLHKDLAQLEQDLLYPSTTQVAIYVSKKLAKNLALSQLDLYIDGQRVTSFIYNSEDNHALDLGGMQRLYLGNLKVGEHVFKAVAKSIDGKQQTIVLEGEAGLYKSNKPLSLSINVVDAAGTQAAAISVSRL